MQNLDQLLPVSVSSPASTLAITDSNNRRSRVAANYICRSGPRYSRNAAVRESCASFRLACSLRPQELKNRDLNAR
jgi:hypothetical protein